MRHRFLMMALAAIALPLMWGCSSSGVFGGTEYSTIDNETDSSRPPFPRLTLKQHREWFGDSSALDGMMTPGKMVRDVYNPDPRHLDSLWRAVEFSQEDRNLFLYSKFYSDPEFYDGHTIVTIAPLETAEWYLGFLPSDFGPHRIAAEGDAKGNLSLDNCEITIYEDYILGPDGKEIPHTYHLVRPKHFRFTRDIFVHGDPAKPIFLDPDFASLATDYDRTTAAIAKEFELRSKGLSHNTMGMHENRVDHVKQLDDVRAATQAWSEYVKDLSITEFWSGNKLSGQMKVDLYNSLILNGNYPHPGTAIDIRATNAWWASIPEQEKERIKNGQWDQLPKIQQLQPPPSGGNL